MIYQVAKGRTIVECTSIDRSTGLGGSLEAYVLGPEYEVVPKTVPNRNSPDPQPWLSRNVSEDTLVFSAIVVIFQVLQRTRVFRDSLPSPPLINGCMDMRRRVLS